jgi:hypothetical protein
MKYSFLLILLLDCIFSQSLSAQELIDHNKMNYLFNPKQNTIIYRDTLYKGSEQFRQLFYRTGDIEIIQLYQKHQGDKIWGGILGILGAFTTGFGVAYATSSSSSNNKTVGWISAGSGLACTIIGGYLVQCGQKKMMQAVAIFNSKYNKITAGFGFSGNNAGLVVNF